jgi:hypothetical protein
MTAVLWLDGYRPREATGKQLDEDKSLSRRTSELDQPRQPVLSGALLGTSACRPGQNLPSVKWIGH